MAIVDQNGKTVSSIWYYFSKGSHDIQVSEYPPNFGENVIFGPYSITHDTPPDVLNEMRARKIEAEVKPSEKLQTSPPRKIAGNSIQTTKAGSGERPPRPTK